MLYNQLIYNTDLCMYEIIPPLQSVDYEIGIICFLLTNTDVTLVEVHIKSENRKQLCAVCINLV